MTTTQADPFAATSEAARLAAPAIGSHMLVTDGPDHARLRRLVNAAFTRRPMEALDGPNRDSARIRVASEQVVAIATTCSDATGG